MSFAQSSAAEPDYLSYVRKFADTLMRHGTDKYGSKHLSMWASLIDTRGYSVPMGTAAEAERTKSGDGYFDAFDRRAVGGANIYHDFETLQAFRVLTALTRDSSYAEAADAYVEAFLLNTQNEQTGLLGWGEHMYYDFYTDEVNVGGNTADSDWTHELLPKKPIWEELWRVSPERTARAIQALRFHFNSPYTHTYIFNRHASWQKVKRPPPPELRGTGIEQYQEHRAAFVGHAGLFAFSFMFLHMKTKDPQWLKWAHGVGGLHWTYRDTTTNLTPWDIDARRPVGPKIAGTAQLAYRLYQTWELNPASLHLRRNALALFDAAAHFGWLPTRQFYIDDVQLDGTAFEPDKQQPQFRGNFGRAAMYIYNREKNARHLLAARRMIGVMDRDTLPTAFVASAVANRMQLLMDVYDVTHEEALLKQAEELADRGIAGLWRGGLFARRVGDPFYESKDGIGSFVEALLRLHISRNGGLPPGYIVDWSY